MAKKQADSGQLPELSENSSASGEATDNSQPTNQATDSSQPTNQTADESNLRANDSGSLLESKMNAKDTFGTPAIKLDTTVVRPESPTIKMDEAADHTMPSMPPMTPTSVPPPAPPRAPTPPKALTPPKAPTPKENVPAHTFKLEDLNLSSELSSGQQASKDSRGKEQSKESSGNQQSKENSVKQQTKDKSGQQSKESGSKQPSKETDKPVSKESSGKQSKESGGKQQSVRLGSRQQKMLKNLKRNLKRNVKASTTAAAAPSLKRSSLNELVDMMMQFNLVPKSGQPASAVKSSALINSGSGGTEPSTSTRRREFAVKSSTSGRSKQTAFPNATQSHSLPTRTTTFDVGPLPSFRESPINSFYSIYPMVNRAELLDSRIIYLFEQIVNLLDRFLVLITDFREELAHLENRDVALDRMAFQENNSTLLEAITNTLPDRLGERFGRELEKALKKYLGDKGNKKQK